MILILMGVSGSGKSSVGHALAARLSWEFIEGDDFHPPQNVRKMHAGIALSDEDRRPWLLALREQIASILRRSGSAVITCSALKQSYRDLLARQGVQFVYLKVSFGVARERLATRRGHFFGPELLQSQFDTLEAPRHALCVDAERSVKLVVEDILERLRASGDGRES
jgi:gluconokinase